MSVGAVTGDGVYRVRFAGVDLSESAVEALRSADVVWEGTTCRADGYCEHSVRMRTGDADTAREHVEETLGRYGDFAAYSSSPLRDATGRPWQGPIDKAWRDIDWDAPGLAALNRSQRAVLWSLLDDHQPLWRILHAPGVNAPREEVELAIAELERRGLIDSRIAESLEPSAAVRTPVPWWAITQGGWDLLGLISSPWYR